MFITSLKIVKSLMEFNIQSKCLCNADTFCSLKTMNVTMIGIYSGLFVSRERSRQHSGIPNLGSFDRSRKTVNLVEYRSVILEKKSLVPLSKCVKVVNKCIYPSGVVAAGIFSTLIHFDFLLMPM